MVRKGLGVAWSGPVNVDVMLLQRLTARLDKIIGNCSIM